MPSSKHSSFITNPCCVNSLLLMGFHYPFECIEILFALCQFPGQKSKSAKALNGLLAQHTVWGCSGLNCKPWETPDPERWSPKKHHQLEHSMNYHHQLWLVYIIWLNVSLISPKLTEYSSYNKCCKLECASQPNATKGPCPSLIFPAACAGGTLLLFSVPRLANVLMVLPPLNQQWLWMWRHVRR